MKKKNLLIFLEIVTNDNIINWIKKHASFTLINSCEFFPSSHRNIAVEQSLLRAKKCLIPFFSLNFTANQSCYAFFLRWSFALESKKFAINEIMKMKGNNNFFLFGFVLFWFIFPVKFFTIYFFLSHSKGCVFFLEILRPIKKKTENSFFKKDLEQLSV